MQYVKSCSNALMHLKPWFWFSNHTLYTLIAEEACGINSSLEKRRKVVGSFNMWHITCQYDATCAVCPSEPIIRVR